MNPSLSVMLATVLVAGWGLAGCSTPVGDVGNGVPSLEQIAADARSRGHDWQAEQLDDGNITLAEFDEGHRRNLACLNDSGISYSAPTRNVVDGYDWLYDMHWSGLKDSEGQRLSQGCFDANLGELSIAMSEWGEWETEPALMVAVVRCVNNKGIELTSEAKNLRDLQKEGADQGLTKEGISTCVQVEMQRLHPGVAYAL